MDEQTTMLFRIICITAIVLGFATYPWSKSPWTAYAGKHTLWWLLIWLGSLGCLAAYSGGTKNPLILVVASVAAVIIGGVLVGINRL